MTWIETRLADFTDGELDPAFYVSRRAELDPDSGCIEPGLYDDVNHDQRYDLVSVDEYGPNMILHLSSSTGYIPSDTLIYGVASGGNTILADLNLDRNPELLLAGHRMRNTTIYWGTPTGPSRSNRTVLVSYNGQNEALYVADLDRDGYLDIITAFADASPTGSLSVFWGNASGYSSSNRTDLYPGEGVFANLEVADFDRDGWLDIALVAETQTSVIYWGPNRTNRVVRLPYEPDLPHGVSVADLDTDGWLDIAFSGYRSLPHSYIYWGTSSGFSTSRRTILDVSGCCGGSAVADVDQDGRLDIVYFRGWYLTSKPKVYYNTGSDPFFDESHSGWLGMVDFDATGGIVADLNFDSIPDLFVHNRTPCYVLWGPDYSSSTQLPIEWDHHGNFREPGSVYDRSPTGWYLSSVYDAGDRVTSGTCSWVAHETTGARVVMAFRSGDTPRPDSTWTLFADVPSNGGAIPAGALGCRYVQYRATFHFDRPSPFPTLEAVTSTLNVAGALAIDVGVSSLLAPVGGVDSGAVVTPRAVCRNFGTVDTVFPVTMLVGAGYSFTMLDTLSAGAQDTVSFPAWVARTLGTFPVTCYTWHAADSNRLNDTARAVVSVGGAVTHDIGVSTITAPVPLLRHGDTVRPAAIVRNYGSSTERYFDVRFRIGTEYDQVVMVTQTLVPDGTVDVTFPPWVARAGSYVATCSTRLGSDINPPNDKAELSFQARPWLVLHVDPDRADRMEVGERKTFSFYAELEGQGPDVVELLPPATGRGWSAVLFDSTNEDTLPDTDADGRPDLGTVVPGLRCYFSLRVEAPPNLIGDTSLLRGGTIVITGVARSDSAARDSALLALQLVPELTIHNFPNPLRDRTTFIIGLPEDGRVTLTVYNRAGECVARVLEREEMAAGIWQRRWDAGLVAPGTYEYLLDYESQGRNRRVVKKLVIDPD